MTARWSLQPDVPSELPPDAVALLLEMVGATTIHDAHELAVDAVKAGASGEQVRAAITEWLASEGKRVQQVFSQPPRCACSHGPSHHTAGLGTCHFFPCTCASYRDKDNQ